MVDFPLAEVVACCTDLNSSPHSYKEIVEICVTVTYKVCHSLLTASLSLILRSLNVCTTSTQIIMIPMPKNVIIIDIKIIHRCTFILSIENNGPATVKLTIFQLFSKTMARMSFSE